MRNSGSRWTPAGLCRSVPFRNRISRREDSLNCERIEATPGDFDLVKHPKFYLFDLGVVNALLGNFKASEDRKGLLLEHLFYNQLKNTAFALDRKVEITHFRTRGGLEVDFIVKTGGRTIAVEVKSSSPSSSELRPLRELDAYLPAKTTDKLVAADITAGRKVDGISVLPWQQAIREIFEV